MNSGSFHAPAYDLDAVRSQFAITGKGAIYLDHASISPLPTPVRDAAVQVLDEIAARGSSIYPEVFIPLQQEVAQRAAALVNAEPKEIAFIENTTQGINLIAQSLPLKSGDNVVLCDVEFPANVYPWQNLRRKGVDTRMVPSVEGGLTVEAVDAARDAWTRVVAVSAVQFFTGRREDLAALGRYCAEHDLWLIVDAIQAAGIVPLDMQAMGIHALATGGQKALLATPGQGFMAIREELVAQMQPVFVGPLSVVGWEHWLNYDLTPQPAAGRFALGTANIPGLAGLNAALEFVLSLGVENIAEWVTHLSSIAIDALEARGCRVLTPPDPARHANIVTIAWHGRDVQEVVAAMEAQGAFVRAHFDAEGNPYLRLSSHCYNTVAEINHVTELLEEHLNEH